MKCECRKNLMKKIIFGITLMMGSVAMAVNSSNIFGILRVDSTQKETIISVPWIAADSVTREIKVADLVLTANLTVGDQLYYYNGTTSFTYEGWVLQEGTIGGEATKVWVPMTTVTKDGISISPAAADKPAVRGAALFVIRPTNYTDPIYLYGRYTTGTASTKVVAGSVNSTTGKASPAYTLIAPALPNDVDLNSISMTGTPNPGDYIQIGIGRQLFYREISAGNWKWCVETQKRGQTTYDASSEKTTIPHGQGCWYVSVGGTPKFTW